MELPVYLDNSATTACDPAVIEAMIPFFAEKFGNASSHFHRYGWEADEAVEQARLNISRMVGAKPSEILFTSGATESCNLALRSMAEFSGRRPPHVITYSTEHTAVLETVRSLEARGCAVTLLGVNRYGLPDLDELESAIVPETVLIAAMYANNETGVLMPVKEMAAIAHEHDVMFFCDATQAAGKVPLGVRALGIDMMAFTAHKMHGPKGIGALFTGNEYWHLVRPQITGGSQERGYRGGTLNVPAIVGFGKASEISLPFDKTLHERLIQQRNQLEKSLCELPGVFVNGHPDIRLPNISNISVEGIDAERLLYYMSSRLALSSGAACASATREPSHVLLAMGLPIDLVHNAVRISQGRYTTGEQIAFAIEELKKAIVKLRMGVPVSNRRQPSSFSGLAG